MINKKRLGLLLTALFIMSVSLSSIGQTINTEPWTENQLMPPAELVKVINIVIYCGCCPFEHCPNIRPAFNLLNEMGFTNQKLLSLQKNIKADCIDKGYPVSD